MVGACLVRAERHGSAVWGPRSVSARHSVERQLDARPAVQPLYPNVTCSGDTVVTDVGYQSYCEPPTVWRERRLAERALPIGIDGLCLAIARYPDELLLSCSGAARV